MDSSITLLPLDMVEEILACVAASSRTALFNAKRSCSLFNKVAKGNYIYQHVSLDGLPLQPYAMQPEEYSFYKKCLKSENPEALFREGVVCFLHDSTTEYGLHCLERAADAEHATAIYILGINLIVCGTESDKQRGIKLLEKIKTSGTLRECRNKLKDILRRLYFIGSIAKWDVQLRFLPCPLVDPQKRTPAWPLFDFQEDNMRCRTCRLNLEINHIYSMLNEISILDSPQRCERILED